MLQISAQMLAMTSEYAVLEKNGKVVYANTGAQSLLGSNCVGMSIAAVFGEELAGIQAPSFIGNFSIAGKHHMVRACSMDGMRVFFISDTEENPSLVNDSFIFSLRNCLMNLNVSMAVIFEKGNIPPEMAEQFSHLCHECYKISRIISNISTIRSLWDKSLVVSPMQIDVDRHFRDTVESVRLLLDGVELRFTSSGPIILRSDPALLDTLLLNLISNCLCHAEGCSRINVALSHVRGKLLLRVDNNGRGIAQDELHAVFDSYRRNLRIGNIDRGTGLGLTAVRLIAAAHDGILLLESREEQGTTVCVSLGDLNMSYEPLEQGLNEYEKSMSTLLTGLADCLPSSFFTEKYLD